MRVLPPIPGRERLKHFTGRSAAGLIAVLAAGGVFGLLLILVRMNWSPLYHLDYDVASGLNDLVAPHSAVVTTLKAITDLGGRTTMFWVSAMAICALFIRRRSRLAIYLMVTGVGALLLDPSLKIIVDRLRPVVDVPVSGYAGNSFPSGHALGSFVVYGALLLVFLPAMSSRLRRFAIPAVALLVFLIGFSRVALSVHFVSDVVAGWLLGAAWLGVTGYAFRLWRIEAGQRPVPVTEGIDPEAADDLVPGADEDVLLPHPGVKVFELITGWVLIFGLLYLIGVGLTKYAGGPFFDALDVDFPKWLEARRTPVLDGQSQLWSTLGNTHAIMAVGLVFGTLAVALLRRWRPVLMLVLVMFGELSLFLVTAAAVDRPRPPVVNMDGVMPTSSFPSGHIAATMCLYGTIAILVFPRTRRWFRWVPIALAVIMPAGVALSRMYRGMHHPTDVFGALVLSSLLMTLVWWVVRPNADLHEPDGRALDRTDLTPSAGQVADDLSRSDGVGEHDPAGTRTSGEAAARSGAGHGVDGVAVRDGGPVEVTARPGAAQDG
jgi:undecaprenyl-diphosphatase